MQAKRILNSFSLKNVQHARHVLHGDNGLTKVCRGCACVKDKMSQGRFVVSEKASPKFAKKNYFENVDGQNLHQIVHKKT